MWKILQLPDESQDLLNSFWHSLYLLEVFNLVYESIYQAADKHIRKELTVPVSKEPDICISQKSFIRYVSDSVVFS